MSHSHKMYSTQLQSKLNLYFLISLLFFVSLGLIPCHFWFPYASSIHTPLIRNKTLLYSRLLFFFFDDCLNTLPLALSFTIVKWKSKAAKRENAEDSYCFFVTFYLLSLSPSPHSSSKLLVSSKIKVKVEATQINCTRRERVKGEREMITSHILTCMPAIFLSLHSAFLSFCLLMREKVCWFSSFPSSRTPYRISFSLLIEPMDHFYTINEKNSKYNNYLGYKCTRDTNFELNTYNKHRSGVASTVNCRYYFNCHHDY